MKHEQDFDTLAVLRAEGEGMMGAKQPKHSQRFDNFDEMAVERAEGEGMVVRKQILKPGVPVELNPRAS